MRTEPRKQYVEPWDMVTYITTRVQYKEVFHDGTNAFLLQ